MQIGTHNEWSSKSGRMLIALLLAASIFGIFWQTTHHEFINYDDPLYITDNTHIKEGLTYRSIIWAFTTFYASNWHPATWMSHMLDYEISGLNPGGHHLTNVFIHIANTLLLLYLLYYATGSYWKSTFAAALFGLHPLHVESVAWISERKDLLSALFGFITLIMYFRYVKRPRLLPYLLALLSYTAGLMAKPMLVTLPFCLLLLDLWPLNRWGFGGRLRGHDFHPLSDNHTFLSPLRLVVEKIPFFVLSLASCVVTYSAQHIGGSVAALDTMPVSFRIINALVAYVNYIAKMLWPQNLAVIYPLSSTLTVAQGVIAGLALLGISLLVYRLTSRHPYLFVGWLWYLGTLVPVIGLIQVGQQSMADRYTYIPLIGLFVMISWGVPALLKDRRYRRGLLAVSAGMVLIPLAISTWIQLGYWENSITLGDHAVKTVAGNYIAYRLLGHALDQKGDTDEAIKSFAEALRIRPDNDAIHVELARVLAKKKKFDEALRHYAAALQINPNSASAHHNLGLLLAEQGRSEEAINHYLEALRIDPESADVHNSLGAVYLSKNKIGEAIHHYREALLRDPGNAEVTYNLGQALAMQGGLDESVTYLNKALIIRPDFAEAHYTLGVALIKMGRPDEGIRHFREALRIKPDFAEARQAMGKALKLKSS